MAEHVNDHGHGAGDGHGDVRVEESSLPNSGILGFVLLTGLVFFGAAIAIPPLFYRIIDHRSAEMQPPGGSLELVKLREMETERLTTYGYVDKDKQIVHIPIDVAMQKVVEDARK